MHVERASEIIQPDLLILQTRELTITRVREMPRSTGLPGSEDSSSFINLIQVPSLQKECKFYLEKYNMSLISHTRIMHVTEPAKKEGV